MIVVAMISPALASGTQFSLITVGQGGEVYLLEGHTALRMIDDNGNDVTVNWGMFNFADPGFAMKFARGETDYWVAAGPTRYFIDEYRRSGREIIEQPLNLNDAEADRLRDLVTENLLPQNRVYRYRYLTDNCATRPLALIERAVGDAGGEIYVKSVDGRECQSVTWRDELRRYHVDHQLYQLFIDIALGADVDRPVSDRERAFAPIYLSDYAARAGIVDADGSVRPLAGAAMVVSAPRSGVAGSEPSPWWFVLPLLAVSFALFVVQWRRGRLSFRWLTALLFVVLSVPGLIVTFLMLASSQEATSHNINILWLNPILLTVPVLIWGRVTRRILTPLMWINLSLVTLWIVGQPFWTQSAGPVLSAIAVSDWLLTAGYLVGVTDVARRIKNKFVRAK